jgi:2-dehydropantoate 2-reductase
VEYEVDTEMWLGPWEAGTATYADAELIATLLVQSGLIAEALEDVRPMQWTKLIFNSAVNSVSALTDLPMSLKLVARDRMDDLGHLLFAMVEEGKQVAAAVGMELAMDPWEMCLQGADKAAAVAGEARVPSMLADIRARRATEIDWITGAIVREAARHAVSTPHHDTVYRLVKALEFGRRASG